MTNIAMWIGGVKPIRQEDNRPSRSETRSDAVSVGVSLYPLGANHPLAHLFGKYDDEPMWEEFEEAIRETPDVFADYDIE